MKKLCLLVGIACSVALLAPMANADEVYSRNVVGYHNITIEPGLNLVAFPFQKIPADTGVITANDDNTITVAGASWAADFGYNEPGESTFYIEIASDPHDLGDIEGRHFYIEAVDGDTLTIADGGLIEDSLVDAPYKIVAANRVRDLFGEPGEPALAGAVGAAAADNILLWTGNAWSPAIYYKTGGFPPTNVDQWNQGANIVNDMVIDRDQAVFVRRQQVSDATLTVVGEVSQNAQRIILSSGLNLVGGLSVVDEIIGDSLLTETLSGGIGAATADTILPWGGTAWEQAIYYKNAGFPPANVDEWNQGATVVSDTFAFSPVKGYFIRVVDEPLGPWTRLSPLAK